MQTSLPQDRTVTPGTGDSLQVSPHRAPHRWDPVPHRTSHLWPTQMEKGLREDPGELTSQAWATEGQAGAQCGPSGILGLRDHFLETHFTVRVRRGCRSQTPRLGDTTPAPTPQIATWLLAPASPHTSESPLRHRRGPSGPSPGSTAVSCSRRPHRPLGQLTACPVAAGLGGKGGIFRGWMVGSARGVRCLG